MYNKLICEVLTISPVRARLVEAYLRLQYGTLDALGRDLIRYEYIPGGISEAIDASTEAENEALAASYCLPKQSQTLITLN